MSEENHNKAEKFITDFKKLVRSYVPEYPETDKDAELLDMIQDRTSCFNPYIWSDKE